MCQICELGLSIDCMVLWICIERIDFNSIPQVHSKSIELDSLGLITLAVFPRILPELLIPIH
jgi:hypothetical protein